MKQLLSIVWLAALISPALAQERPFCNPAEANCASESLEIRFVSPSPQDPAKTFELNVTEADVGQEIDIEVFIDVETEGIQGWSYGVQHDPAILEFLSITTDGLSWADRVTFDTPVPAVGDPTPGFVHAVVLEISVLGAFTLPVNGPGADTVLVDVKFRLAAMPPAGGAKLEFTSDLRPAAGSPPTATNLTISQQTRPPGAVVEAVVLPEGGADGCTGGDDWGFYFGTDPSSAEMTIAADAASFLIGMRNRTNALGFSMGVRFEEATKTFTFENEVVGTDADRRIELIITDVDGGSQIPPDNFKTNSAVSMRADNGILSVATGPALEDFPDNASFLAIDLMPGVGGPGFTAGFVADTNGSGMEIPATESPMVAGPCPVNAILEVTFGEPPVGEEPFNRGDADGNGRLNVTDAALVAQNIFLDRLKRFDCDEMLDANNDDALDGADPIVVLEWLFLNGPALPAPFRTCAVDAGDALGCLQANCTPAR